MDEKTMGWAGIIAGVVSGATHIAGMAINGKNQRNTESEEAALMRLKKEQNEKNKRTLIVSGLALLLVLVCMAFIIFRGKFTF